MAWEAWVEVLPDLSKFDKRANDGISNSLTSAGTTGAASFGTSFKSSVARIFTGNLLADIALGAGQRIGDAIGAGLDYALGSIDLASNLSETKAAITQVFGDAAADIVAFSETANTQLGQTQQSALVASQTFGVFARSAGLTGKPLADFSTGLVTLSGDLASFFNADPSEVIEALGAGLRGEAEPLRRFGVLLDDATLKQRAMTLGIYDGNGSLTSQQRILAAQAEIFAQTGIAQGDFARTSDGLANQQRILNASLEETQTKLGEALLPGFNDLVSFANTSLLPKLSEITDAVGPRLGDALTENAPKFEQAFAKIADVVTKPENIERFADGIDSLADGLSTLADVSGPAIDFFDSVGKVIGFFSPISGIQGIVQIAEQTANDLAQSQRISDSARTAGLKFSDSYAAGVMNADGFARASDFAVAALSDAGERLSSEGGSGSFAAGENFADALADGIESGKIKVGLAGFNVAQAAVKGTKTGFQQRSPSKLGLDIGENYVNAIGLGMLGELDSIRTAASQVVSASSLSLAGDLSGLTTTPASNADLRPYLVQLIEETAANRIMVADGVVLAETANRGNAQQTALGAS